MPEEVVLRCDAPGCEEMGEYCTIIIDGKSCEVILCVNHQQPLKDTAAWGRPSRGVRSTNNRRARRSTDEERLLGLLDADKK